MYSEIFPVFALLSPCCSINLLNLLLPREKKRLKGVFHWAGLKPDPRKNVYAFYPKPKSSAMTPKKRNQLQLLYRCLHVPGKSVSSPTCRRPSRYAIPTPTTRTPTDPELAG